METRSLKRNKKIFKNDKYKSKPQRLELIKREQYVLFNMHYIEEWIRRIVNIAGKHEILQRFVTCISYVNFITYCIFNVYI